jgi:hypothetical protein
VEDASYVGAVQAAMRAVAERDVPLPSAPEAQGAPARRVHVPSTDFERSPDPERER